MALSPDNYHGRCVVPSVTELPPHLPSSGDIFDLHNYKLPAARFQATGMARGSGILLTGAQIEEYERRRNEPFQVGSPILSDQKIFVEVLDPVQQEAFKAQHPHIFPTLH